MARQDKSGRSEEWLGVQKVPDKSTYVDDTAYNDILDSLTTMIKAMADPLKECAECYEDKEIPNYDYICPECR